MQETAPEDIEGRPRDGEDSRPWTGASSKEKDRGIMAFSRERISSLLALLTGTVIMVVGAE
jgi:hypothetical protein